MTAKTDPPRRLAELKARLLAAGASDYNFAIGRDGRADDVHRLSHEDGLYQVAYMERGLAQTPIFTSPDEAAACAFYYNFIMRMRHDHCCGLFTDPAAAEALAARLRAAGLGVIVNTAPHSRLHRLHRVFVSGRDVFAARALLGEIPIRAIEE